MDRIKVKTGAEGYCEIASHVAVAMHIVECLSQVPLRNAEEEAAYKLSLKTLQSYLTTEVVLQVVSPNA